MTDPTYTGPDRRRLPRESSLPPDASATDRILMRLGVIRRLLLGGYVPELAPSPFTDEPNDGRRG